MFTGSEARASSNSSTHQGVLNHLHILLNYQWDSRALLTLVLVPIGFPELETQLERRRNRSQFSRIHHRATIDDASANNTAEFVAYPLKRAGARKSVFTVDAIELMHEQSAGSLRILDRIAQMAIRDTAGRKKKVVDRDTVEPVLVGKTRAA